MYSDRNYQRNEIVLAAIASIFFLMYGVVPFALNELGIYNIEKSFENMIFSIVSSVIPFLLYFKCKKFAYSKNYKKITSISESYVLIVFALSIIIFAFFPWHEDRESIGASVAAIFRGVWLILIVQCYGQSRKKIFRLFLYTTILMLVDQSRTAFGLAFFVLGLSYSLYSIIILIFLMSAVAAWRMGESVDIISNVLYGIVGEGYNGARGALQSLQVRDYEIDYISHIFQILLQPIFTPFQIVFQKIGYQNIDVTRHIGELIDRYMNEDYSPMGGFYISSEFEYYGYLGLIFLFVYLFVAFLICKKLFDTSSFPMGSLIFLISIKASPYVFWKYVLYLYLIQILMNQIQHFLKMSCHSSMRSC